MRLLFGLLAISVSLCASSLPELPSVSTANFQPAIRSQIEKARQQAADIRTIRMQSAHLR